MSRFLSSSRRTTCTQRNTTRLSIFGIRPPLSACGDEVGRVQHVAALGAQPRHRLVVAHLALRQRHDRLQVEVDPVGLDRVADVGQRFASGSAAWRERRPRLGRAAAAPIGGRRGGRYRRRAAATLSANETGRRARRSARPAAGELVERRLCAATVSASCLTSVPSSPISAAERLGRRLRALSTAALDRALHRGEAAAQLGDLARQVGGAARQVGDLVADRRDAQSEARRDRIVERERGQGRDRDDRRLRTRSARTRGRPPRRPSRRSAPCRWRRRWHRGASGWSDRATVSARAGPTSAT